MKITFIILSFILTGSFIYQSYSFTSSLIGQEVSYNVVSEEQALISIDYNEMEKSFTLTNNTKNTIKITHIYIDKNVQITNENMQDPFLIAGHSKEYFIEGDTRHLSKTNMNISITSENMKMEISSPLPPFNDVTDEAKVIEA